jgi:hypothetical protein
MNRKKTFTCITIISIFILIFCYSIILHLNSKKSKVIIPISNLNSIFEKYVKPISINPSFGGKVFSDYKVIDSNKKDDLINVYISLFSQEYYVKNNKLYKGTGGNFYAIITVRQVYNSYKFINCNISRSEEEKESLKIFPKSIRKKVINREAYFNDFSLDKIQKKAEEYFSLTK